MDVIDIDEVLKDDSFCLFEERGQDDITNILQQWKSNFNLQPGSKLDTRTFTRPKRKSTSTNYDSSSSAFMTPKLQDISPPPSLIFSSLDPPADQMNNSLITSADFKNVGFFMASPSDDFLQGHREDDSSGSVTLGEGNILQALTLSGDSTFIKDSNIAQIDHDCTFPIDVGVDDLGINSSFVQNRTFDLFNDTQIISKPPDLEHNTINTSVELSPTSNELTASDVSNMFNKTYGTKEVKESCSSNATFTSEESANEVLDETEPNKTYNLENVVLNLEPQRPGTPENDLNCERSYDMQSTPTQTVYNIQNKRLVAGLSDEINLSPVLSEKMEFIGETEEYKQLNGENKILKELYSKNDIDLFSREVKDEEDFDDLLESIGKSHIVEESNKIRQSLDNIKKRHSLISEKCNNDAKPKVLPNNSSSCKPVSCERLLSRRSRLYDEVPLEKLQNLVDSIKETSKAPEELSEVIDNHESTNQENGILAGSPEAHIDNLDKPHDRDRFKTIRVLKKREEELKEEDATAFVRKDTNASTAILVDHKRDGYMTYKVPKKDISSKAKGSYSEQPRSNENSKIGLSNPRRLFYNGKAEVQSKVNSTGELEKCSEAKQSKITNSSLQDNRTLPMKAKSYQNLTSQMGFTSKLSNLKAYSQVPSHHQVLAPGEGKKLSDPQLQFNRPLKSKPEESDANIFKVPSTGVQIRNNPRSGLVRPSSGFYSYQMKGNGELESRHSSSNSLSSASSRGSIQEMHRNGISEQSTDPATKRAAGVVKSGIPKPSGIKPPRRSIIPVPSSSVRR